MAAYTQEYVDFRKRLRDLTKFLPPPSTSTSLSAIEVDQMSAFVLLAHAACEHFMEVRSLQVATAAKSTFDAGGPLGRVGKHLCVFPFLNIPKQADDFAKLSKIVGVKGFGIMAENRLVSANRSDIHKLLNIGFQRFKQSINHNHGAGHKYQFRLLSLLGLDLNDLGANFRSRIAQLAEFRGEAAHTKVVAAITQHTPAVVATWPLDLIEGYRLMDLRLAVLARQKN